MRKITAGSRRQRWIPLRKKPLYHFLPGTKTFSVSSYGCNFTCRHCQNFHLSHEREIPASCIPPDMLSDSVRESGAGSISFTYNEPAIWFEYVNDAAKAAGVPAALITNGYISEEALKELAPHLGAVRIDLKAFTGTFYRHICGAEIQPVLDTILLAKALGLHLELVTLVIPGLNDSPSEIDRMLSWETENLGCAIPHHFTGFTPAYRMKNIPATSSETLDRILHQAREHGLSYPYTGNIRHKEGSDTICPACGNTMISRTGYAADPYGIRKGRCSFCGRVTEGVFATGPERLKSADIFRFPSDTG
jgi:pyruvate formate lyase activating enzyme